MSEIETTYNNCRLRLSLRELNKRPNLNSICLVDCRLVYFTTPKRLRTLRLSCCPAKCVNNRYYRGNKKATRTRLRKGIMSLTLTMTYIFRPPKGSFRLLRVANSGVKNVGKSKIVESRLDESILVLEHSGHVITYPPRSLTLLTGVSHIGTIFDCVSGTDLYNVRLRKLKGRFSMKVSVTKYREPRR